MSEEILEKIYNRMKDYAVIKELAVDNPKIANLAYHEVLVSLVETIYKFDGLEYLFSKLQKENNDLFTLMIAVLLLPYKKTQALVIINNLRSSKIQRVVDSADNILSEKYSSVQEIADSSKLVIEKVKKKLSLQ